MLGGKTIRPDGTVWAVFVVPGHVGVLNDLPRLWRLFPWDGDLEALSRWRPRASQGTYH